MTVEPFGGPVADRLERPDLESRAISIPGSGHPAEREAGGTAEFRRYPVADFTMQFGEQRPMEPSTQMVGGVIAQVAGQDVVPTVFDIEGAL